MTVKRFVLIYLVLAIPIGIVGAQDSAPPRATDFSQEHWKEFVSNDGAFRILMPGTPVDVSQPIDSNHRSAVAHLHALTTRAAEFSVGYTTFGRDLERFQSSKLTLDGIRDGVLVKESGKLLSEEDIFAHAHPGRALVINVADGIFRDRYFLVGNRLYSVTIFVPNVKAGSEVEIKDIQKSQEAVAKRFLDSFQLLIE